MSSTVEEHDELEDGEKVMTFRQHLGELRGVLMRVSLALVLGFFVGWSFRREIFEFLSSPVTDALADNGIYHYQAISIAESIVVYLKAVLIADIAVLSPFIFYQLWSFVGPGLLDSEKRFVAPLTVFSVVFFLIGSAFAYTVILPFITDWLVKLTVEEGAVEMLVTMQNAYSTSFTFLLMFGLVFELPLVIYFLALFGAATHTSLLSFWRYFVVLSFIISAMLTPPDPISQVLMAVPLNGLYGFGIIVAWGVVRTRRRLEAEDPLQQGNDSVGSASMRIIGAGLVLLLAAGAMVVVLIQSLPGTALNQYTPESASWYVNVNPSALKSSGEDNGHSRTLDALLEGALGTAKAGPLFEGVGIPLTEVTRAGIIGGAAGERLLLVRQDGVGAKAEALYEALTAQGPQTLAHGLTVAALDEDTVVLGAVVLFQGVAAIAGEEAPRTPLNESEDRMLRRLHTSGPVWAWLPRPSKAHALLSSGIADEVVAAGAFLKAGTTQSIAFELRARDRDGADALEARVESAHLSSRGARADRERGVIVDAVRLLAEEARLYAPPQRRPRIVALLERLKQFGGRPRAAAPVFDALSEHVEAWSIRREDAWIHVTAELGTRTMVEALTGPKVDTP